MEFINRCLGHVCTQYENTCNPFDCSIFGLCQELDDELDKLSEQQALDIIKKHGFAIDLGYFVLVGFSVDQPGKSIIKGGWKPCLTSIY